MLAALVLGFCFLQGNLLVPRAYFYAVFLVTFAAFGLDKFLAIRGWRRIPEDVLLVLVCIGGTWGALCGGLLFNHKTQKPYFKRALTIIAVLQIVVLLGIIL